MDSLTNKIKESLVSDHLSSERFGIANHWLSGLAVCFNVEGNHEIRGMTQLSDLGTPLFLRPFAGLRILLSKRMHKVWVGLCWFFGAFFFLFALISKLKISVLRAISSISAFQHPKMESFPSS